MINKNLKNKNPLLLLVDVQKAFLEKDYPGLKRNNHNAELNCGKILKKWRELGLGIIHVRHSSNNPESKLNKSKQGFEFNDHVKPLKNEKIITKNVMLIKRNKIEYVDNNFMKISNNFIFHNNKTLQLWVNLN